MQNLSIHGCDDLLECKYLLILQTFWSTYKYKNQKLSIYLSEVEIVKIKLDTTCDFYIEKINRYMQVQRLKQNPLIIS